MMAEASNVLFFECFLLEIYLNPYSYISNKILSHLKYRAYMANTAVLSAKIVNGRINILNSAAMRSAKSKPFEDIGNKVVLPFGSLKVKPKPINSNLENEKILQNEENDKQIKASLNEYKVLMLSNEEANNSIKKILCTTIATNRLEDELSQRFKYQLKLGENEIGEDCVIDIDKFDHDKPTMQADYVKDIYAYMSDLEVKQDFLCVFFFTYINEFLLSIQSYYD
jgi:hypothetical protein